MNILTELIKESGHTPYRFAKTVGISTQAIYQSLDSGGDLKFSIIKKYAEKCGIKYLEIKHGNCKVTIKF